MMKKNDISKDIILHNLAVESQLGSEECYRELLLLLASNIRPFLYGHIFNKDLIEDVLQDILLTLHKSLHTYSKKQSFLKFSFVICRYKLVKYISKYQKISENEITYSQYVENFAADQAKPIDEALEEKLQIAIDNLPKRQRQVILMLKVKNYNVKDVSAELKISISNVKFIAYQAYKALREKLND